MGGERFRCWWCREPTDPDDLIRMDEVVSLSGFKPGPMHKTWRVCRDCLLGWSRMRSELEFERFQFLSHLPK